MAFGVAKGITKTGIPPGIRWPGPQGLGCRRPARRAGAATCRCSSLRIADWGRRKNKTKEKAATTKGSVNEK